MNSKKKVPDTGITTVVYDSDKEGELWDSIPWAESFPLCLEALSKGVSGGYTYHTVIHDKDGNLHNVEIPAIDSTIVKLQLTRVFCPKIYLKKY